MNRPIYGNPATTPNPVADFNQNNPKKADYIKNRPFYEDTEFLGEANYAGDGSTSSLPVITSRALVEGEKIIVYREQAGKTNELVASSLSRDNTGDGYSMFDNGVFYSWDGNNKIEIQIDSDSPASAKVYSHIGIKQLDEKFIPNSIARKEEVTVDEWKHLGTSTNDSGEAILEFPLPLEAGDTIRITAYANPDSGLDTKFDETHVFDGIPFYACGDRCYVESTWLGGAPIYTFTVYKQVSVPIKDKVPEFATKADVEEAKYTYVTDKKLGEAVPMIGDTTTFIGLDEELNTGDMIMVKGYFNDGTSESYVVEVGEIGGDYSGRIDADVGRLDKVHVPISTSVTFQSEIKGEVYKMNKVLISDAVTEIDTALNNIIEKYGLGGDA